MHQLPHLKKKKKKKTWMFFFFGVVRAGQGGAGIHITNKGRGGRGCERQARGSAWVRLNAGSRREARTPSPPHFQKPSAPKLSAHTSLPSHCSPFSTSPAPISLYVQLAAPQRLRLPAPNDPPRTPTCFVLLIFPLPRDKSLDAKIKKNHTHTQQKLGRDEGRKKSWE